MPKPSLTGGWIKPRFSGSHNEISVGRKTLYSIQKVYKTPALFPSITSHWESLGWRTMGNVNTPKTNPTLQTKFKKSKLIYHKFWQNHFDALNTRRQIFLNLDLSKIIFPFQSLKSLLLQCYLCTMQCIDVVVITRHF